MHMDIPTTGHSPNLQRWMDYILHDHSHETLSAQLHDDVVFESPIVHTPQRGKAITLMYLGAAGNTLGGDAFRYTKVFDCGDRAVIEFESEMDGIHVNGIDMISWNEEGQIVHFKVMVRPLKAIQTVHAHMKAMLETMKEAKRTGATA
ncbi:MAG: nuclear transport factor 2 family protein [Pseudomonadota bacterium]